MAEEIAEVQCVFCLSKYRRMVDPLVLPCSHASCKPCLIGQKEEQKVVWCKDCKKVFEVEIDDLPAYASQNLEHECNSCLENNRETNLVVIYCISCLRKYCELHWNYHNKIFGKHTSLPIAEYAEQKDRLEARRCTDHPTEECTLACAKCLHTFCSLCVYPENVCEKGNGHTLCNCKFLVARLTAGFDKDKESMIKREKELERLSKEVEVVISKFDQETDDMLGMLETAQKTQIAAIEAQYMQVKTQFLESRRKAKEKMTDFKEEKAKDTLDKLKVQRSLMEFRLKNNHLVDIIRMYKHADSKICPEMQCPLPRLELDKVYKLQTKRCEQEVNVDVVSADSISIGFWVPSLLALVKSVRTGGFCLAICNDNEQFYFGIENGTINVLDKHYNLRTFAELKPNHAPSGVAKNRDNLCVLVNSKSSFQIHIYDSLGKFLSRIKRIDSCLYTRLAIVSNQIVVPDYQHSRIVLYAFEGNSNKKISVSWLKDEACSVCAAEDDSVVITAYNKSLVCRVSIASGKTIWKCGDVKNPQAVTIYRNAMVCVASHQMLSFLNICTGEKVHELAAGVSASETRFTDMAIHKDTVALYNEESGMVSFYKMEH